MPKRKTLGDAKRLAAERGGKCLSNEYINNATNMKWQCEKGHVWCTIYRNIRAGYWCPGCRSRKHTIDDARLLAKERDGECLSKEYINTNSKLLWRCSKGHEWPASYHYV